MPLTLWRGNQQLGELRSRAQPAVARPPSRPRPPSLSAFLIPSGASAPLDGVWQSVWPREMGVGVQQSPVEVDIVAERGKRFATRVTNPGPVALEPMSAEAVAGVPWERQLTVRAADGAVYLPSQILLQEVRYEPALYVAALREAPSEALVDGSVWCVFIAFASDTESPAI